MTTCTFSTIFPSTFLLFLAISSLFSEFQMGIITEFENRVLFLPTVLRIASGQGLPPGLQNCLFGSSEDYLNLRKSPTPFATALLDSPGTIDGI